VEIGTIGGSGHRAIEMGIMKKAGLALMAIAVLGASLGVVGAAWAQDEEEEGPMSNMRFVVLRD